MDRFRDDNTEGFTAEQLAALNAEFGRRGGWDLSEGEADNLCETILKEWSGTVWAVVEVDSHGQVRFDQPVWGIGLTEQSALLDAERWLDELWGPRPEVRTYPCTLDLYNAVETYGGAIEFHAPGTGHVLEAL